MSFDSLLRHSNLVAVAVLVFCILGIAAAARVPVQMIPDVETRVISVETRWPGATPQDVEQEILIEQEQYLRSLPGLSRMVGTASSGQASIRLEFPFGVDINEALIRTNNALSQVPGYPENVDAPALTTESASSAPFLYLRLGPESGRGEDLDLAMITTFVENEVRPRLERVPGVSLVEVNGGAERQVQIEVDPDRLAQRGLDLTDVRQALRERNLDVSAGDVDRGKRRVLVRTVSRFEDVSSLGALILTAEEGAITRLSDVADIRLAHHEQREITFLNGDAILIVAVRREPGANVIDTKYAILPEVAAINEEVLAPEGLRMALVSEDARYVEASIVSVWRSLVVGALLATAIMYLFLRSARTTLIGVISMPICTIAAFVGLLLAGRTLNVISLAGVAFAMGMAVDNAVVVIESIDQARRRGLKPLEAAAEGVRRVWPAVLACTLTSVIVFIPILLIQEEAGQLFSDIAIAIAACIVASLVVAVTVVPAMAARLGGGGRAVSDDRPDYFEGLSRRLAWFTATPKRRVGVLAGAGVGAIGVLLLLTPPAEYLPEGEEARVFADMVAPPGYNLAEMRDIAQELIADLQPAVTPAASESGRHESRFPALNFYTLFVRPDGISVIADPRRPGDVEELRNTLENRLRSWPGMRAYSQRGTIISSEEGGTRSINLNISGADLAEIFQVADRAYERAQQLFEGAQLSTDPGALTLDQPLIEIRPAHDRLAEVGLDASRLGYAVAALGDGAFADEMILDDRRVDISLFNRRDGADPAGGIAGQPIVTPQGGVVPLSSLAEVRETIDSDTIRRLDGRRTVTLSIVPPRSIPLETGVQQVRRDLLDQMNDEGEIPQGVSITISGAADQLDATRTSLLANFGLAVALCYFLLVATFRHWWRPFYILITVPVGVAGGMLGLALLNGAGAALENLGLGRIDQPLDMITFLGFLVLLGSVINNPILIVMETCRAVEEGVPAVEAANEAVRLRLRPILMSTFSTIIGMAPLVVLPGAGTELYRGLGVVMLAGIAISTVVSVTFLPALLVEVSDVRARVSRWLPGLKEGVQ
ncbi:MAG: multidrug efflux pump subunit AcrB [Brevundimonas sp.]|jgi:multidrug efflux pump subunit AcrB|uniref:efflux RND transporter permease subunit n=1 Tax=Brevundimonas sp. TaxID=1871086 RepID=UPI0039E2CA33